MFQKIKTFLFENSGIRQTIAKNTFWLFSGQLISRLMRAVIVIYAARVLGVENWGAFSYALGVASFLTIFSDIGINGLITKEGSRNPELKSQYLATAFFIKLGLLTAIVLGVNIFFPYLTKIPEAAVIMPILIFVFAFDTLRDLGSALSRALEKMQLEAGNQIFTNFTIAVLGILFLKYELSGQSLALAYAIGSFLGLLAIIFKLRRYFKNIFGNFNKKLIKPILVTSWPFGLLGIMGVIMLNTDIIMLGWLKSPTEVGYYAAAQKLIQLLYVLPSLLAVSIFPILSRLIASKPEEVKKILEKSVAFAILTAIPIALIGAIWGNGIIQLFFGEQYLPAAQAFRILMLTIVVVYPSSIIGHAIFAYDQQKKFLLFVLVAIIGNIFFNSLFIPKFGIEGAAFATVITQVITNLLIWKKMRKISNFSPFSYIKNYLLLKTDSNL